MLKRHSQLLSEYLNPVKPKDNIAFVVIKVWNDLLSSIIAHGFVLGSMIDHQREDHSWFP